MKLGTSVHSSQVTTNMTLLHQTIAHNNEIIQRNHEAYWAFGCVTFLFVLIFWGVWYTKMWRHKNNHWEGSHEPIVHDLYTPIQPHFNIRDLLHIRTKYIPLIKSGFRKHKNNRLSKKQRQESQPICEEGSSDEEEIYR